MKVLLVGTATLDVVNLMDDFPEEDDEVRALGQRLVRGGNAANTAVVLSQLGHACDWAGALADEPDSRHITDDLARHRVGVSHALDHSGGKAPTSYITLSRATGSRTIVHHRDLPEYPADAFGRIDLAGYDWVHFEGRNVDELEIMLRRTREQGVACSLEVEKARPGIERLFALPSLLLFSRHYAQAKGFESAAAFLDKVPAEGVESYCAWGDAGAWVKAAGDIHYCPAFPPPKLLDTLGAGDVFNAGVIHGRLSGGSPEQVLETACRLAGYKCGVDGLDGLAEALP